MNIATDKFLVVNTFDICEGTLQDLQRFWEQSDTRHQLTNAVLYNGVEDPNAVLLLYEVEQLAQLPEILQSKSMRQLVQQLQPLLASDFHQEVVGLVERVLPRQTLTPTTNFIQLRRIEVPLSGIESYLEWRERRIFAYVRQNKLVKSFLAFHSVFSTTPGVLFVAEFEASPGTFRDSFLTPAYREIITEANTHHIKGRLSTVEYQRLANPSR